MAAALLLTAAVRASASPFAWDTVRDLTYAFCYNASGPYNEAALASLAKNKLFIHGMNERQEQAPAFQQSEEKVIASAKQLLAANPAQQQFYTIQNDYTRAIYDSGAWFNAHPECLLRDEYGGLVNHSNPKQKNHECTAGPNKDTCYVYGFQTQCGRDAWVKFAVDTVSKGGLQGVFIDGFQGCSPEGKACGRALSTCSAQQSSAWLSGLSEALWELHRQLKALGGNKTIICNGTGRMFACHGAKKCYCDAANKERFYPNEGDLEQVVGAATVDNGSGEPFWGIIHVPHVNEGVGNFNKSLAGFLATAGGAGTPFGYGVGFEYDCEEGGWLREFPELEQKLGPPTGPPKMSDRHSSGPRSPVTAVFSREYSAGVKVFYNASDPPHSSSSCIEWGDGSRTEANGGCVAMDRWRQAATKTLKTDEEDAAVAPAGNLKPHGFYLLFAAMTEAPDWPAKYESYRNGVVVMYPSNATAATVQRVKADLNATVLLYFDSSDIAIETKGVCSWRTYTKGTNNTLECNPSRPCSTGRVFCCDSYDCQVFKQNSTARLCPQSEFHASLQRTFKASWAINLLDYPGAESSLDGGTTRTPVCNYYFGPLYCPFAESVEALSTFLASWVQRLGFDGLYLDEFFPASHRSKVGWDFNTSLSFDSDGDGEPNSLEEMKQQYATWHPRFSASLRAKLGPRAMMLGNTGGGVQDPAMNGLTIEMEHCANVTDCIESLMQQYQVSAKPARAIVWLTHSNVIPKAAQCAKVAQIQKACPFAYPGTDFYDGSHVVC